MRQRLVVVGVSDREVSARKLIPDVCDCIKVCRVVEGRVSAPSQNIMAALEVDPDSKPLHEVVHVDNSLCGVLAGPERIDPRG